MSINSGDTAREHMIESLKEKSDRWEEEQERAFEDDTMRENRLEAEDSIEFDNTGE